MTCGIYKLTFKSGAYYIGKSIDIENRWKQHFDKLLKGTAAGPVQAEYRQYGFPNTEVIAICHKDHLDLLESFLITNYATTRPERSLNTSFPECVSYDDFSVVLRNKDLIKKSTIELLLEIENAKKLVKGLRIENDSLTKPEVEYIRYTDDEELESEYKQMQEQVEMQELTIAYLREEITNYKNLPWWKRIFK